MRKIFLDLLFVTIILSLIGWDRSYVPDNLEELQEEAVEKNNLEELPPNEFYTDGCSLWPQAIFGVSWEEVCIRHDMEYWVGGSDDERLLADLKLRDEVNAKFPGMGDLMFWGIRAGGKSLTPLVPWPWGWGYGWDNQDDESLEIIVEENENINTNASN